MRKRKKEFVQCPFTVVVDTREQQPFAFQSIRADAKDNYAPVRIDLIRHALPTGDYSIQGLEHRIAIERKGKGDLFNCVGNDRPRFEEQVRRLNEMEEAYIAVECSWLSIFEGHPRSRLRPKSVHRTVISWTRKYKRVHWWFCVNRNFAEATTFRTLESYWKELNGA